MDTKGQFIETLLKRLTTPLRDALLTAYEEGVEDGQNLLRAAIEKKFEGVFSDIGAKPVPRVASHKVVSERAPRGSAKPAVLGALKKQWGGSGMTTKEVFDLVAVNAADPIAYNTVRGTLYRLTQDKVVVKNGDRWALAECQFPGKTPETGP